MVPMSMPYHSHVMENLYREAAIQQVIRRNERLRPDPPRRRFQFWTAVRGRLSPGVARTTGR